MYLDQLHSGFNFFVPLFFSIIYLVTFVLNLGYVVEERANKTKVSGRKPTARGVLSRSGIPTHLRTPHVGEQSRMGDAIDVYLPCADVRVYRSEHGCIRQYW